MDDTFAVSLVVLDLAVDSGAMDVSGYREESNDGMHDMMIFPLSLLSSPHRSAPACGSWEMAGLPGSAYGPRQGKYPRTRAYWRVRLLTKKAQ